MFFILAVLKQFLKAVAWFAAGFAAGFGPIIWGIPGFGREVPKLVGVAAMLAMCYLFYRGIREILKMSVDEDYQQRELYIQQHFGASYEAPKPALTYRLTQNLTATTRRFLMRHWERLQQGALVTLAIYPTAHAVAGIVAWCVELQGGKFILVMLIGAIDVAWMGLMTCYVRVPLLRTTQSRHLLVSLYALVAMIYIGALVLGFSGWWPLAYACGMANAFVIAYEMIVASEVGWVRSRHGLDPGEIP